MSRVLRGRTYLLFLLAIVILFGAGTWEITDYLLPRVLVVPFRQQIIPNETPARYGIPFDKFDFRTSDGLMLKGWFVHAMSDKPVGTVIVLHGMNGRKEQLIVFAQLLVPHGYNAIIYDSRAQGQSEGRYCTYGMMESKDVSRCIDEAQKRYGDLGFIAVIGSSFGSAVALRALADDKRFSCGIVSSPFCNLKDAARRQLKSMARFDSPWLLQHVLDIGSKEAGFHVEDINLEQIAKSVQCPVLVIHGEKDQRFPVGWGRQVYESVPSAQKQWYMAKGCGHDDIFWLHDAMNVKRTVLLFLAKNMKTAVVPLAWPGR